MFSQSRGSEGAMSRRNLQLSADHPSRRGDPRHQCPADPQREEHSLGRAPILLHSDQDRDDHDRHGPTSVAVTVNRATPGEARASPRMPGGDEQQASSSSSVAAMSDSTDLSRLLPQPVRLREHMDAGEGAATCSSHDMHVPRPATGDFSDSPFSSTAPPHPSEASSTTSGVHDEILELQRRLEREKERLEEQLRETERLRNELRAAEEERDRILQELADELGELEDGADDMVTNSTGVPGSLCSSFVGDFGEDGDFGVAGLDDEDDEDAAALESGEEGQFWEDQVAANEEVKAVEEEMEMKSLTSRNPLAGDAEKISTASRKSPVPAPKVLPSWTPVGGNTN